MVAAAVVAAGALAAGSTALAGSQAASAQKSAAQTASNAELGMFGVTQGNLAPFTAAGQSASNALLSGFGLSTTGPQQWSQLASNDALREQVYQQILAAHPGDQAAADADFSARFAAGGQGSAGLNVPGLTPSGASGVSPGSLIAPFNPTQAGLEATPGYQFTLNQGLKAVSNSNAARGLGVSGAALRGAADYSTGLADSTYNQQFSNYLTQQDAITNRLMGLTNIGQSSAANVGSAATNTGSSLGSNAIGAGNASGAASMATANAVGSGANNLNNLLLVQSLAKNGGGGIFNSGTGGGAMGP